MHIKLWTSLRITRINIIMYMTEKKAIRPANVNAIKSRSTKCLHCVFLFLFLCIGGVFCIIFTWRDDDDGGFQFWFSRLTFILLYFLLLSLRKKTRFKNPRELCYAECWMWLSHCTIPFHYNFAITFIKCISCNFPIKKFKNNKVMSIVIAYPNATKICVFFY